MTVKELNNALEEMRSIYPFDKDKTIVYIENIIKHSGNRLSIQTADEKTGIIVSMDKIIKNEDWHED